jgi:hypothetical protein
MAFKCRSLRGHYGCKSSTYNEVDILIREKDDYLNASKVCEDHGKKFEDLANTEQWKEDIQVCKLFNPTVNKAVYTLNENNNNVMTGIYVHPKLTHTVIEFCDDDYAKKVVQIMALHDKLNKLYERRDKRVYEINRKLDDVSRLENEKKKLLDLKKRGY